MSQNFTVVLRDLQSLLQETIDSDVEVVNYETTNLLPKGEQYGSTLSKVEALVKKKTDSPEEKMYFVAKMLPTSKYQQEHLNMTNTFTKEIYIVQKLSEFYRELEREAGIEEEDSINVFPKFCGGRLTRKKDTVDVADEDAVILLENLKVRGYVMIDRLTGLNFEHAKLVITELAHFHALGTALKIKKPKIFETVKKLMINTTSFEMKGEEFQETLNYTIQILCEDPRINQYKDRVKRALTRTKGYDSFLSFQDIEPWISIGHGDVWKNNILFHHVAENGKVDDVKFDDYQTSRVCSPLKDIPYFLCTSLESSVVDNHFDELLEIYHDKFVNVLAKISCDVSSFTKKSFEEQLNRDAKDELFHCVLAIKFITVQISEDMDDIKSAVLLSGVNQLYRDMSWRVVSKFVEKADNGKVDVVKFVDFQMSRICNPLRDIQYLLGTSSSPDVIDNHFDELLEIYHTELVKKLMQLGCVLRRSRRKALKNKCFEIAKVELARSIINIKFVTMEVPKDMDMSDIKSLVMMSGLQKAYYDRSWQIVSKFIEKGWI